MREMTGGKTSQRKVNEIIFFNGDLKLPSIVLDNCTER